jgi:hypothetical protein
VYRLFVLSICRIVWCVSYKETMPNCSYKFTVFVTGEYNSPVSKCLDKYVTTLVEMLHSTSENTSTAKRQNLSVDKLSGYCEGAGRHAAGRNPATVWTSTLARDDRVDRLALYAVDVKARL